MTYPKKSRKLLLVSTALMIIALSSILTVYASVVLGTFNGNAFTVNDVTSGTVRYSTDGGSTWNSSPSSFNVGGSLYARFEVSSTSYNGPVTITWQLQKDISGTWTPQGSTVTTTVNLSSSSQIIYASSDGNPTGNTNWGTGITDGGSYRISATVTTA